MYFDQILVHRSVFPTIPNHLLEFFRETEESFWHLFFFLYTYASSMEDVCNAMDDSLREVEWATHDLCGDGLTYEKALGELHGLFTIFATNATRQMPFLRNPRDGSVISDVRVELHDAQTMKIHIEFTEEKSANLIPLAINIMNNGSPNAARTPLLNHHSDTNII